MSATPRMLRFIRGDFPHKETAKKLDLLQQYYAGQEPPYSKNAVVWTRYTEGTKFRIRNESVPRASIFYSEVVLTARTREGFVDDQPAWFLDALSVDLV